LIELEVGHGETEVYARVQARGGTPDQGTRRVLTQASEDLGVHQTQLRGWVKAFAGQGQMKAEQLEIARLRREVAKLKAERDILKKAAAYFAKEST
jgi:transposase-like protein